MKSDDDLTTRVLRARSRVLTRSVISKVPVDRGGHHIPQDDAFHHESLSFLIPSTSRNLETRTPVSPPAVPFGIELNVRGQASAGPKRKGSNEDEPKVPTDTPTPRTGKQGVALAEKPSLVPSTGSGGGPNKRGKRFQAKWTADTDRVLMGALTEHGWGCWKRIAESGKLAPQITPKMIANRAKALGLTPLMFSTRPPIVSTTPTTSAAVAATAVTKTTTVTAPKAATASVTVSAPTTVRAPTTEAAHKRHSVTTGTQVPAAATIAVKGTEGAGTVELEQRAIAQ